MHHCYDKSHNTSFNDALCTFCPDVSHALRQFVFECMQLTSVDDAGAFPVSEIERQLDIPWDDPYPYYAKMIPTEPPDDDPVRCTIEDNTDDASVQPSDIRAGNYSGFCNCFLLLFIFTSSASFQGIFNPLNASCKLFPTAAVRRVQHHTGLTHNFYFLTFRHSGAQSWAPECLNVEN